MPSHFIDMRPAPALIQAALDHCEIPLIYGDDHTVDLDALDNDALGNILSAAVTIAMMKHMEDTLILPTNVARLREIVNNLGVLMEDQRGDNAEYLEDQIETLNRVAYNLDPAKR